MPTSNEPDDRKIIGLLLSTNRPPNRVCLRPCTLPIKTITASLCIVPTVSYIWLIDQTDLTVMRCRIPAACRGTLH